MTHYYVEAMFYPDYFGLNMINSLLVIYIILFKG